MYHRDLNVWKLSVELVRQTYELLECFPQKEEYALAAQIRRSSVSVPSNIAEGCGRGTNKELYHFLNVASGSLSELETQMYIAWQLGYITDDSMAEMDEKIDTVQKLLVGFRKHIKSEIEKNNPDC